MAHESTVWVIYGRLFGLIVLPGLALIPVCFWSISCYIDRDLSRAYNIYISEINVSYICYMMPASMIYIYKYIYIYWNICMMKFLWNFILFYNFSSNKSGVVMGPALSSLVAPQVVITTSGAARGGRVGFMAALDCSMFNVYSALTIYLFSRPSFIQNSVRCSIARSEGQGIYCELRILMIVKPEFWLSAPSVVFDVVLYWPRYIESL